MRKALDIIVVFVISEITILCDLLFISKTTGFPKINSIIISMLLVILFIIGIILRNISVSIKSDLYIISVFFLIIGYSGNKCFVSAYDHEMLLVWIMFAVLFFILFSYSIILLIKINNINNIKNVDNFNITKYVIYLFIFVLYTFFSDSIYNSIFDMKNNEKFFIHNSHSIFFFISALFIFINIKYRTKFSPLFNIYVLYIILSLIIIDTIIMIIQFSVYMYLDKKFVLKEYIEIAVNIIFMILSIRFIVELLKKPQIGLTKGLFQRGEAPPPSWNNM